MTEMTTKIGDEYDECETCHKTEPEVPLCLFTVIMMDGRETDETMCPNCANRASRFSDVFRVELYGNILSPRIKR